MLRQDVIMQNMLHLIGFQKDTEDEVVIANSLLKSDSGLYYQQGHSLITLKNLFSVAPQFASEYGLYDDYVEAKEYVVGEKCMFGESNKITYRALVETSGVTPGTQEAEGIWEVYTKFSEWLENKITSSTLKALRTYFTEKMSSGTARSLLDNKILYDGTGRLTDLSKNTNSLVGFELTQVRSKNATIKINKIGLQMTQPGTYNLYIMHSSQEQPIKTIQVTKVKANSLEWKVIDDVYLPCAGDASDGGSYYIVYDQKELPEGSSAIYKSMDWSAGPCPTCSRQQVSSWQTMSKYVQVQPFKVNSHWTGLNKSLWDVADNQYMYSDNFGINLDLSIMCDFTNFFVTHKYEFENLILKQFTIDMFKEFINNPNARVNRNSMIAAKGELQYELDGEAGGFGKQPSGLMYEYKKTLKALSVDMKMIDRFCMPCKNNGVRYGTI